MKDILTKITDLKRKDLSTLKSRLPLRVLLNAIESSPEPVSLSCALKTGRVSIIAEVKKASPSKGLISRHFTPVKTALEFEKNGAAAISVLTEENFFLGNLGYLAAIKGSVRIPILRKDFIVDEYQLFESRAAGADAVLLITACLTKRELRQFIKLSRLLCMDALVETHDTEEVLTALDCGANIIGINNRNLRDFSVDIRTSGIVRKSIPPGVITVSESGIASKADIRYLSELGINGALIGETLMRSTAPGKTLRRFT